MKDPAKDFLGSGKRGKMEMIAVIVAVAMKTSTLSRIKRHTNLNGYTTSRCLKFMIEKRLINKQHIAMEGKKMRVFESTAKGITFLKTYCSILTLIYGENFLENTSDLAVACLQLSKESQ